MLCAGDVVQHNVLVVRVSAVCLYCVLMLCLRSVYKYVGLKLGVSCCDLVWCFSVVFQCCAVTIVS